MMQKEKIQHKDDMTVTLPSDREVLITRTLHAPRKLVFEAMTEPRHLKQWLGPRVMIVTVAEADLREGGAWRFIHRAPDGTDHVFSGGIRAPLASLSLAIPRLGYYRSDLFLQWVVSVGTHGLLT